MRWEERCCKPNSGGDVKTLSAQDSGFATLGELVALLQDLAGVETRPPGCKRGLGSADFSSLSKIPTPLFPCDLGCWTRVWQGYGV